jgi:hypothetical protein
MTRQHLFVEDNKQISGWGTGGCGKAKEAVWDGYLKKASLASGQGVDFLSL